MPLFALLKFSYLLVFLCPKQNLSLNITEAAAKKFHDIAKRNKKANKSECLPFWALFVIKDESIDVAEESAAYAETDDVNAGNFVSKFWEPLVETINNKYSKDACLVVVDMLYTDADDAARELSGPVFFKWCPDTGVPVRTKMLLGSSFQAVKRTLGVYGITPQLSQASELDFKQLGATAKLRSF